MKWTSSVLVLFSLFALPQAQAQNTTGGNATTGGTLWSSKGCGPGCHLPSAKPVNAANAGGHITYAIAQGMPASVTPTEAIDIAAYLAGFAPDPNPANVSIPFNTGTAIPLPNIYVNSTYGKFTSLQTVTAPTRGSVMYSYVGNNATATYTPTTGQTGTDSFTFKGIVAGGCSGGCSSNRTVTVNILPPSFLLTILKQGTGTGKVVSSPAGINCNPTCTANLAPNTVVTLTATADPGSALVELNSQPSNTYQFTLTANTNVSATFDMVPNDNFADRIIFVPTVSPGSSYAYIRRFNTAATKEAGEPNHAGNIGGASLWYSWTAPFTGSVNVVTGSSANLYYSDFNTLLAAYTGSAVNALTLVASNDDVNPANSPPNIRNLLSSVTFQAIAGTTYQIAVDGSNTTGTAETGKIDLTIIQPGNDLFAARLALSGSSITVTDNNNAAYGTDSGEPLHAGIAGGKSLWWSWTAPINGTVNINTAGSNFNTLLGVYTGTAVNALTPVASNNDVTPGTNLTSAVSFTATAGTTYQIAVDGFNGDTGNITLNINQAVTTLAITGNGTSTVGNNVTFTATLSGGASATGSVNFKAGASTITGCGAVTLSSNVATCTTNTLPVASFSITAIYSGDTNNTGSTSPGVTQTVNKVSTTTALSSSANPSIAGNAVITFTATVTGASPTGSINFKSDATTLTGCGAVALTSGSATCMSTFTTAGSKVITADYSGNTNNAISTGTLSGGQTVNAPTITLAPLTLPGGTVNAAYSQSITASGGTAPHSYAVTAGSLPTGLTLSSAGLLSGPVTTGGGFNFTVTATDANAFTGAQAYAVTINPASQTVTFAPASPITFGATAITLTATASSGLTAFTFSTSSAASICSVTGNQLTTVGGGTCALTATQPGDANNSSAFANANVVINPILTAVQSRKTHGGAGDFDVTIDTSLIAPAVTVEPRVIGGGHKIVFQFNGPVSIGGTASVTPVGIAVTAISGNDVLVTLTNVPDNQRVTVTLTGVNGSINPPPAAIGFLVGDVNNTRSVNSSDISSVKARSGQTTTTANFRFDLNASGAINSSDISAVKARSGLVLP